MWVYNEVCHPTIINRATNPILPHTVKSLQLKRRSGSNALHTPSYWYHVNHREYRQNLWVSGLQISQSDLSRERRHWYSSPSNCHQGHKHLLQETAVCSKGQFRYKALGLDYIAHISHKDTQGWAHIDGLMQERRNSSVLTMELRLSCTNPSIYIKTFATCVSEFHFTLGCSAPKLQHLGYIIMIFPDVLVPKRH